MLIDVKKPSIIIDKDLVTIVNDDFTLSNIKTEDIMTNTDYNIKVIPSMDGDFLPKNLRYFKALDTNRILVVIEEEPQIRSVQIENSILYKYKDDALRVSGLSGSEISKKLENEKLKEIFTGRHNNNSFSILRLSFPYIIIILVLSKYDADKKYYIDSSKLFMRTRQLKSLDDHLSACITSNVNDSNTFCLGNIEVEDDIREISVIIQEVVNQWWTAAFTDEYTASSRRYHRDNSLDSLLVNPFLWALQTKEDPHYILKMDLIYVRTLREILRGFFINNNNYNKLSNIFYNIDHTEKIENNEESLVKLTETFIDDSFEIFEGLEIEDVDTNIFVITEILKNKYSNECKITIEGLDKKEILTVEEFKLRFKEVEILSEFNGFRVGSQVSIGSDYLAVIKNIRKNYLNLVTAKIANRLYILDDKSTYIKLVDKVKVRDIWLNLEDKFILLDIPNKVANEYIFICQDVDSAWDNYITIKTTDKDIYTNIYLSQIKNYRFFKDSNKLKFVNHFIFYSKIISKKIISNENILFLSNIEFNENDDPNVLYKKTEFIEYLSKIEKGKLNLTTFKGIDLNLSVGNNVIIWDWKNPKEMPEIRKIIDLYIENNDYFIVKTISNESKVERNDILIDLNTGVIFDYLFSKITDIYCSYSKNDILKCIYNSPTFSKGENYKIIGFINAFNYLSNTTHTLALFNNCATIDVGYLDTYFKTVKEETVLINEKIMDNNNFYSDDTAINIETGELMYWTSLSSIYTIEYLQDIKTKITYYDKDKVDYDKLIRVGTFLPRY